MEILWREFAGVVWGLVPETNLHLATNWQNEFPFVSTQLPMCVQHQPDFEACPRIDFVPYLSGWIAIAVIQMTVRFAQFGTNASSSGYSSGGVAKDKTGPWSWVAATVTLCPSILLWKWGWLGGMGRVTTLATNGHLSGITLDKLPMQCVAICPLNWGRMSVRMDLHKTVWSAHASPPGTLWSSIS